MKQLIGSFMEKKHLLLFVGMLFLVSLKAEAATTVTVDNNEKVTVIQPSGYAQPVVTPVVITREGVTGDFEGRIIEIDTLRYLIIVQDTQGRNTSVSVKPEMINHYRVGDTVLIHPTTDLTVMTLAVNPKDFEGEIIRVDIPNNQIVVQDTTGRERKVLMKQGMIGTYKVDDYVRIHLMADLKEAKTIETVNNVRNIEGNIVSVDASRNQIVVRGTEGKESVVILRPGQVNNYRVGDHVRIYHVTNQNQVQVIRII